MKVCIDEMPKDCVECPCFNGDRGTCNILHSYTEFEWGERPENCPLESTKPVDAIPLDWIRRRVEELTANSKPGWSWDKTFEQFTDDEKEAVFIWRMVDMYRMEKDAESGVNVRYFKDGKPHRFVDGKWVPEADHDSD